MFRYMLTDLKRRVYMLISSHWRCVFAGQASCERLTTCSIVRWTYVILLCGIVKTNYSMFKVILESNAKKERGEVDGNEMSGSNFCNNNCHMCKRLVYE